MSKGACGRRQPIHGPIFAQALACLESAMSWTDLVVAAVTVACFFLLGWSLSLSRRLNRIERHSKLDPLTGLGSGHWLESERWHAALRSGRALGVVYLDLDHLKLRNDRLGHGAGDEYIKTAAEAISKACRRGVDEVFRVYTAGDEFVILLHGLLANPSQFGWSLLSRLRRQGVMASIGMAYTAELDFVPARAELKADAEAACRRAKKLGGDCALVIVKTPSGSTSETKVHEELGANESDGVPVPVEQDPVAPCVHRNF